jgi:hypothetical protein
MRYLKSIYGCFLVLFQLLVSQLHGQQLPIQTFSLAADHFVDAHVDGLQIDWRLDLGLTNLSLSQSNSYHFTAGFLQPTINRFANDALSEKYTPSIEIKNTMRRDAILLFSKEPDLILFGFKIIDLHGRVLVNDQTKYRSSYAGRYIDVNAMNSGVYIMQVLYLPEHLTFESKNNYRIKNIKFIKP